MKKLTLAMAFLALAGSAAYAQDGTRQAGERGNNGALARADADSSGDVSFEEFAAAMRSRAGLADADGDGKLTVEEIAAEIERMRNIRRAERLVKRFDANGDGTLTVEEVESRQRKMFALADRNDDGVLDRAEMPRRQMHQRGTRH